MIIETNKIEHLMSELWSVALELPRTDYEEGRVESYSVIASKLQAIIDDRPEIKKKTTKRFNRIFLLFQILALAVVGLAFVGCLIGGAWMLWAVMT